MITKYFEKMMDSYRLYLSELKGRVF